MSKAAAVLTAIFILAVPNILADRVVPSNRVTSRVLVRESPSTEREIGQYVSEQT
jgi:hypothetical protein